MQLWKLILTPLRQSNLSENADDRGCKKTKISIVVVLILVAIFFLSVCLGIWFTQ